MRTGGVERADSARAAPVLAGVLSALLVAGCSNLPQSGPVDVGDATSPSASAAPFDFKPPGPAAGASRREIVAGFLRALQATPQSTSVAAQFVTTEAATTWRPDRRTVVYSSQEAPRTGTGVSLELGGVFELDRFGRYRPQRSDRARTVDFELRLEDGEWRIADPPDAMIIPRTHFEARYLHLSAFFFDPTGTVLVPEQVHLPSGVQAATRLVSALLAGPPAATEGVERSFLPPATRLGVGVPVDAQGVADVPLVGEVLDLGPGELDRAVAQLGWTLRQLPEIRAMRLTVDGDPVELYDTPGPVAVGGWARYSPAVAEASTDLFGLRDQEVVQLVGEDELVAASLARSGIAEPRSLGVDMRGTLFAVVSSDGARVDVVAADSAAEPGLVRSLTAGDLLRPLWDHTGRLWLVDRDATGPDRVIVGDGDRQRTLRARGLRAMELEAAAISRDGTRLVLLGTEEGAGRLVLYRVIRREGGRPVRLGPPTDLGSPDQLTDARGLAWRDPGTVAVLTRPSATTSRIVLVSVDGSSGDAPPAEDVDLLFDAGREMAASPGGPLALVVRTRSGGLHALDPSGRWMLDVAAPGLRAPAFVG